MSDKKSEKKRKRQAEQGELPNKKAGGGDAKDKRIKLNIVQEESYGRPAIGMRSNCLGGAGFC